ncbi:hypothetical protein DWG18_12000 [Lysobacter sp. TY2-98]|uniref:hypothetical protein n=1 Tax=Lysobacter sp. TY2-98 TaxID=2290922 RepID=UPI000E2014FE|nr:hypothetical protein [Lysobacter sp. TY2-98]AXK72927.1 hypothetical protein DWG18_12000 [Lysobacter sp. TY2-98]
MRTDPTDRRTTRDSRRKDEARDLDRHGQKVSPPNRPETQAEDTAAAIDRSRSRDPGFGRGHH